MVVHSLDPVDREAGLITELAWSCPNRGAFRHQLLQRLDRLIGFELAIISNSPGSMQPNLDVLGFELAVVREQIPRHMAEFYPQEVAAICTGHPVVDSEVLSASRRAQLSLYHEQLWPNHVTAVTIASWWNRFGIFGTLLARTSHGCRFSQGELNTLERLLPSIKLAEALLSTQGGAHEDPFDPAFDAWATRIGLSPKEREIASFVAKGLTNQEIAKARHVAQNTIRNQLSTIYQKAEVDNRTELVRAMTETGAHLWWNTRCESRRVITCPWLIALRGASLHVGVSLPEEGAS